MIRTLKVSVFLASTLVPVLAFAQDNPPADPGAEAGGAAPAAPADPGAGAGTATPPPEQKKKRGGGPSLSLDPSTPQVGGLVVSPSESIAAPEESTSSEWKFDVTGYFRAPMRMSWGPATTTAPDAQNPNMASAGTQFRTPPMVPDANYIDWRYTNSFVAPWTELNFHYGNDRVKATVQIASYNLTDPGYRRLEANLGINQAFITMKYPELWSEDAHLTLTVGGFTNRYGAAGRYDAGRYETYLFGRTHVAGLTATIEQDVDDWTIAVEGGGGAKLEPIPFYGPPGAMPVGSADPRIRLPAWEPYPGPVGQESGFVVHGHLGAVWKKMLLLGAHYIDVFANDNERSSSYQQVGGLAGANPVSFGGRPVSGPGSEKPNITIWGFDAKLLGGVVGDGYIGFSHLKAENAQYLGDAIEVLHSFGGWQLHDNYFGPKGAPNPVATGSINTVLLQYSFSFGQLFHYPQAFWGDGPDIIATVFAMYNKVDAPMNTQFSISKLKAGTELTYVPISWLGLGARYDLVQPNLDNSDLSFSVISPRVFLRTAFVTHEQIMFQYSRYFYGAAYRAGGEGGMFPYSTQAGAAGLGVDSNAFQVAAIIWF